MKQFENEYKEYIRDSAPDLWERIEAGVDAKIAQEHTEKKNDSSNNKQAKKIVQLVASLAACFAALALIVPVYRLVKPNQKADMTNDVMELAVATAEGDMAEEETASEAASADDVWTEDSNEAVDEKAMPNTDVESIEYTAEEEAVVEAEEETEEVDELETNVSEEQSAKMVAETEKSVNADGLEEESLFGILTADAPGTVTLIVSQITQMENGSVVYLMKLVKSEEDSLVGCENLTVYADETMELLVEGQQYEVKLGQINLEQATAQLEGIVQ